MTLFAETYRGRRVLVTGHTGFKGSWLAAWLQELGARTSGLALPPATTPSHWQLLGLDIDQTLTDIRDASAVAQAVQAHMPEIVFHLAAQPLVRRSYRDPLETWSTNVGGTANVLEACRQCPSVRAIVVITTDKCYENHEWEWGYRENDRLGGHDPYSASKAATEILVASYRDSFFHDGDRPLLASARAGNVIGGGDWSEDRLIPDLVRAVAEGKPLLVRAPASTRPWQHVLESLSGYLRLGQKLLEGDRHFAQAWNFGPRDEGNRRVADVLAGLQQEWPALQWQSDAASTHPHEAGLLHLDSSKAQRKLEWRPVWSFDAGLAATAGWYRCYLEQGQVSTREQIAAYVAAATAAGLAWSQP